MKTNKRKLIILAASLLLSACSQTVENEVWKKADSSRTTTRVILLVTNDPGRHLEGIGRGFVDHGDHCEGCTHKALLTLGPSLPPGRVVESHYGQIDVSPTTATLLNFPRQGEGHPIQETYPPIVRKHHYWSDC